MKHVSTTLLTKSDRTSQWEGEKLDRLCLSFEEREFHQDAVKLLSPFEKITRHICGAKYCTLSLVHPYVELLKKSFAPKFENDESYDTYLDLIYGPNVKILVKRSLIVQLVIAMKFQLVVHDNIGNMLIANFDKKCV
ncbi:hypothetical protein C2G38_274854 [Gigaspora rosea]|uniref:Uncharacterized protein n=1 Tax=Gigaspora rosea TaxID=44941 RepID=A0A397UKS6_9GLOM|nr:hypothetical protein C2G38_274854 [Gigaspora rosea]